jgi:hypothetical protein
MTRPGPFPAVLTDPRVQLGVSVAALLATASTVRHDRVGLGRPGPSGPLTACLIRGTGPPGPSCNWVRSAPFLRRPRQPGWPETASWRVGSSPEGPAPGRFRRWSSR